MSIEYWLAGLLNFTTWGHSAVCNMQYAVRCFFCWISNKKNHSENTMRWEKYMTHKLLQGNKKTQKHERRFDSYSFIYSILRKLIGGWRFTVCFWLWWFWYSSNESVSRSISQSLSWKSVIPWTNHHWILCIYLRTLIFWLVH